MSHVERQADSCGIIIAFFADKVSSMNLAVKTIARAYPATPDMSQSNVAAGQESIITDQ
jgi:hypothetical protein